MAATITLDLADEAATCRLGRALAELARPGDAILLAGPLGAGKSTLARAFIRVLAGEEEEVPSPTFTLVQAYDGTAGPLYHFDLYRLKHPDEVLELGFEDCLAEGICLVEWPERLGPHCPRRRLEVTIEAGAAPEHRRVRLLSHGQAWNERLEDLL